MDHYPRSQSVLQVRTGSNTLPSRASRILQKVTGRIRLRKPAPTSKDDNHPYPVSRLSGANFKPYMSQPMLSNTLREPREDQDSSSHSGSPSESVFPRPNDKHTRSTTITPATAITNVADIDGLPVSLDHNTPSVWTPGGAVKAYTRPPRPTRPAPEAPTLVDSSSEKLVQPTSVLPMTAKADAVSTFSPARLFTRKASRANLNDQNDTTSIPNPPSVPPKHRQTPSIVISGAPDQLPDTLPPSPPSKRPKPAKIDTSLSPARLFTRKSRTNLQDTTKRTSDDPPTPYTHGQRSEIRPPSPPPLPTVFSMPNGAPVASKRRSDDPPTPYTLGQRSKIRPPSPPPTVFSMQNGAPVVSSSSMTASSSSSSSYYTSMTSISTTTISTNTTPASTTITSLPSLNSPPPRLNSSISTPVIPSSPLPPILQRSETAPHSYRLSLRMTPTVLRPPPLPLLNLPTLPPSAPIVSSSSSASPFRALRAMPELPHDGGRRQEHENEHEEEDDEEDLEDIYDDEGRISRNSNRTSHEPGYEEEDSYRPRPSFSSAISINTTNSSLTTGNGKTHSRSSSYQHSHSHDADVTSSSHHHSEFLNLPGPDTSRLDLLDLSFLSLPPELPEPQTHDRKGKARARPEDNDEREAEGGKTPTSAERRDAAGYFSYVPKKEGLRVYTSPDVLANGHGWAKGRERDRGREMDTARPGPMPLQASVSMGTGQGGPVIGVSLGRSGSLYSSKRASRSLVDIGAVARREKVEELVRGEEEKKAERRRSTRLSRIEASWTQETIRGVKELQVPAESDDAAQEGAADAEDPDSQTIIRAPRRGVGEGDLNTIKGGRADAMSLGLTVSTPIASTNSNSNRLSMAPAYETVIRASYSLHRRRSMPTFSESSEPPPYPDFPPHSPSDLHNTAHFALHNHNTRAVGLVIQPRDDEGREKLPGYSNDIYLRAVLPRKMEFVSAGVQAKDRKWRRVVCVVEGTSLKVYKPREGRKGRGVLGDWWERKVGVGDVSSGPVSKPKETEERDDAERQREREAKLLGEGVDPAGQTDLVLTTPATPVTPITPTRLHPSLSGEHPYVPGQGSIYGSAQPQANRSRLNLAVSSLLRSSGKSHSRTKSDATAPNLTGNSNSPRSSFNMSHTNTGGRSSFSSARPATPSDYSHGLGVPSSASSVRSQASSVTLAHAADDPRDLMRAYTMQNAESGLGNDYIKRKNVIRVRTEGEQFLLQAKDVTDVVTWIEVLQASANVALDLDERLMPKGPLFPRRRRRRARPATAGASTGAGTSTGTGTQTPAVTNGGGTNGQSNSTTRG